MNHWINITPIIAAETHGTEIAKDLQDLFDKKAIDSAAFSLSLVPEGNPAFNKAADYMKRFRIMREKLKGSKLPVGALLQSTMGHGWTPDTPTEWTKFTFQNGSDFYSFCPEDPRFRKYIYDTIRTIALEKPDFFMLDDDTRFITGRGGCYCPLHLAKFSKITGRTWEREELVEALKKDPALEEKYDKMLEDSILQHAKTIREAIDSVDPSIPCFFCTCSQDTRHAIGMTRTLAAPGQELIVRINNARYLYDNPRSFASWQEFTAIQVQAFPKEFTLLAEPDTCPQNRYSTSNAVLNAQLTMSLLLGCRGGKIWITRLSVWEPASGKAYREQLINHNGFYRALENMQIKWTAPCLPISEKTPCHVTAPITNPVTWSAYIPRMGIPVSYDKSPDRTAILGGWTVDLMTDSEIRHLLSGNVLMDGSAALKLTKRGYADLIGISAAEWKKETVSVEILKDKSRIVGNGNGNRADLSALHAGAEVLSTLYHRPYMLSNALTELAPGAVFFKNAKGGKIITLAQSVDKEMGGFPPFVILCETRKHQLIEYLNRLAPLDLYAPGDEELTLMTGIADGRRLLAVLNLGLDPVSTLTLKGAWVANGMKAEMLAADGSWRPVELQVNNDELKIKTELPALGTAVIRFLSGEKIMTDKSWDKLPFLPTEQDFSNFHKEPNDYVIVINGNSITRHSTNEDIRKRLGWVRECGMAASSLEHDYVHLFAGKIQQALPNKRVRVCILGKNKPDYSQLLPDLVIFQGGEHVRPDNYDQCMNDIEAYFRMVQALASKPQTMLISIWNPRCYDEYKTCTGKGYAEFAVKVLNGEKAVAERVGARFVDVSPYENNPGNTGCGEVAGVRWHPNDNGMRCYAEAAFTQWKAMNR